MYTLFGSNVYGFYGSKPTKPKGVARGRCGLCCHKSLATIVGVLYILCDWLAIRCALTQSHPAGIGTAKVDKIIYKILYQTCLWGNIIGE